MVAMKKQSFKVPVAVVVSASLAMAMGGTAHAEEPASADTQTSNEAEQILGNKEQATELLQVIDQIPEEVLLKGDAATSQWVNENLVMGDVPGGAGASPQASFLKCSGAVLAVVASTAIPAAKILKIKRYMKALGGTAEAIKVLWGASFSYEKLQALGGAAAALGAELLGITAIKEACTD